MRPSLSIVRNFVLKHRVFLLRNWEKMREKQELLKREGERERDTGSLSIYTRWGGVIRDDGNIKSGEHKRPEHARTETRLEPEFHDVTFPVCPASRRVPDAVLGPSDVTLGAHTEARRRRGEHRGHAHRPPRAHLQGDL